MDIDRIRSIVRDGRAACADHPYRSDAQAEGDLVLRALRSLFERELEALSSPAGATAAARNDTSE